MNKNQSIQNQQAKKQSQPLKTAASIEEMAFPVQKEIDRLEEMILDNPNIPFLGKTLVDEDKLINQLDSIRISIPDSLEQALAILQQKEQIIAEAQNYAQNMVENAHRKAAQILDESRIMQEAQIKSNELRRKIQQDCESLQRNTLQEVEQLRRKIQQEAHNIREQSLLEAEEIQNEADDYADAVLSRLEKHLGDMLRIVHNGRQQLNQEQKTVANRLPVNTQIPTQKAS